MTTIRILTSLEYLGTYGDSDNLLGATIQVSSDTAPVDGDPVLQLLRPWKWAPVAQAADKVGKIDPRMVLWQIPTAGGETPQPVTLQNPKHVAVPLPSQTTPSSLVDLLDAQFDQLRALKSSANPFDWTGARTPEATVPQAGVDRGYRWPARLAQLGRYPYPIPHQLQLSFFLNAGAPLPQSMQPPPATPAPAGGGVPPVPPPPAAPPRAMSLVAAPIFMANGVSFIPDEKAVVNIDSSSNAAIISYQTSPAQSFTVQALVQPLALQDCTIVVRPAGATVSMDKLDPYLALPVPEDTTWQHELVPLSAELFDISARLIGLFELAMTRTESAFGALRDLISANFETFRGSVVMALHDVADCGAKGLPGNTGVTEDGVNATSLIGRIYTEWERIQSAAGAANSVPAADRATLRNKLFLELPNFKLPLADWSTLLQGIAALKGNAMLTKAADMPTSDAEKKAELLRRLAALEEMHLAFMQNDSLGQIIAAQWSLYAKGATTLNTTAWTSFLVTATDQLQKIDLRKQMVGGNLGTSWGDVLIAMSVANKPNTLADSRATLRASLSNALLVRMNAALPPLPNLLSAIRVTPSLFATQVFGDPKSPKSWVDMQLMAMVPDPFDPATSTRQPTQVSTGVTFMLDGLSAQDKDNAGKASPQADAADLSRSMGGLCVLARRNGTTSQPNQPQPWRCLTLAGAWLNSDHKQILTPRTVLPVPIHDEAGLRNATITYNNQPLMGKSPEMMFGGALTKTDTETKRLLEYVHPSLLANPLFADDEKIPGLVFGQKYDFVVGVMRNSGALPELFAAKDDPGTLSLNRALDSVFSTHGKQVLYQRTVKVGGLRFGRVDPDHPTDGGFNKILGLPPIPADVQPRALELIAGRSKFQPDASQEPLVLLTDYGQKGGRGLNSFSIQVQKPSTDIRTWDAWVADDPQYPAAVREGVWAEFHEISYQQTYTNPVLPKIDIALDDPAVDQLQLQVEFLDAPNAPKPAQITVAWPAPSRAATLAGQRSNPITVTIVFGDADKKIPVKPGGPNEVVLNVENGALIRLTLTPTVVGANRFASGILPAAGLGNPYSVLVETATDDFPSPQQLRDALTAALTTDLDPKRKPSTDRLGNPVPTRLSFSLSLDQSKTASFRAIGSARLRFQKWRWDGRAGNVAYPFLPTIEGDKVDPKITDWEAEAFSTRTVYDSSQAVMTKDASGDKASNSLSLHEDISTDLGLLYFRYGVIAFNRYGELVPPKQQQCDSLGTGLPQFWKRIPVKLRWKGTIPKPAVKVVFPLTTSLDQSQRAASLLVVVQGPWYAVGGLAEQMKAELLMTSGSSPIPEAGPDPILWEGTQADLDASKYTFPGQQAASFDSTLNLIPLQGPVGHTFDDVDQNPLWVNTSFVVPPILSSKFPNTSWNMAKIQFRRLFDARALLPSPAKAEVTSDPTDPYWVQFLPNHIYLPTKNTYKAEDVLLQVDTSNTAVSIKDATDEKNKAIVFQDSEGTILQHFLLLTERVPDMLGRSDQERYIDIVAQNADASTWTLKAGQITAGMALVGRVVEVEVLRGKSIQISKSPTTSGNCSDRVKPTSYPSLWDALFPEPCSDESGNPVPVDAVGRIVAVSPPIFATSDDRVLCGQGV